jgi:hypothetical protein
MCFHENVVLGDGEKHVAHGVGQILPRAASCAGLMSVIAEFLPLRSLPIGQPDRPHSRGGADRSVGHHGGRRMWPCGEDKAPAKLFDQRPRHPNSAIALCPADTASVILRCWPSTMLDGGVTGSPLWPQPPTFHLRDVSHQVRGGRCRSRGLRSSSANPRCNGHTVGSAARPRPVLRHVRW